MVINQQHMHNNQFKLVSPWENLEKVKKYFFHFLQKILFLFFHDICTGGPNAQTGPGRAFGIAGRPAGFAGRAKPAPGSLFGFSGESNAGIDISAELYVSLHLIFFSPEPDAILSLEKNLFHIPGSLLPFFSSSFAFLFFLAVRRFKSQQKQSTPRHL